MADDPADAVGSTKAALARALPGMDDGRLSLLSALASLVAHVLFADVHYSRTESQRLRSGMARLEWLELREREALLDRIERDLTELTRSGRLTAERTVRRHLSDDERAQVYDALVEIAAASGGLDALITMTSTFGRGVLPSDRAAELGVEVGSAPVVAGLAPEAVRFDDEWLRLGTGMHEVVVAWQVLERLEAVDPWPSLFVRWRERGYPGDATFRGNGDVERLVASLKELFDFGALRLGARAAAVISRGWLDMADVEWETVAGFPEEPKPGEAGVYRTAAARRPDEPVVARRARASPLERLLGWLASSPETPWSEHVEEMVVTDRHLYARHRDGRVARVPLWSLRTRLGGRDGVYVFGRRTRLVVPQRDAPCPVAQHLDALLRAR